MHLRHMLQIQMASFQLFKPDWAQISWEHFWREKFWEKSSFSIQCLLWQFLVVARWRQRPYNRLVGYEMSKICVQDFVTRTVSNILSHVSAQFSDWLK